MYTYQDVYLSVTYQKKKYIETQHLKKKLYRDDFFIWSNRKSLNQVLHS